MRATTLMGMSRHRILITTTRASRQTRRLKTRSNILSQRISHIRTISRVHSINNISHRPNVSRKVLNSTRVETKNHHRRLLSLNRRVYRNLTLQNPGYRKATANQRRIRQDLRNSNHQKSHRRLIRVQFCKLTTARSQIRRARRRPG